MKLKKMNKREYKQATAILKEIVECEDVKGNSHIYINCEGNLSFSNFKNVWDKQGLDIEHLEKGDKILVTYYCSEWGGKNYNNFVKVEFAERPRVAEKMMNAELDERSEVQKLVDELDLAD